MSPGWEQELKAILPQTRLKEPLSRHTTWGIGGPADAFLEVGGVAELQAACRFIRERKLSLFLLGGGSNTLVRDGGIRGVVLRLRGDFERIERLGDDSVRAGAGVRLSALIAYCVREGLEGAEPLTGVPGTLGGALVMNAGTREGAVGPLVRSVDILREDLGIESIPSSRIRFSYRHSSLEGRTVLGAVLELKGGGKVDIMSRVRRLQKQRLETQPVRSRSGGSVFKNPPGHLAARLIQDAGLKGLRVGGAMISRLHANFIENVQEARARDVLELIEVARHRVRENTGLALELEIRIVGEA